jgi:hypothetical protein
MFRAVTAQARAMLNFTDISPHRIGAWADATEAALIPRPVETVHDPAVRPALGIGGASRAAGRARRPPRGCCRHRRPWTGRPSDRSPVRPSGFEPGILPHCFPLLSLF